MQETLLRHRGTIRRLNDRLFELRGLDDGDDEGSSDAEGNQEEEVEDEELSALLDEEPLQTPRTEPAGMDKDVTPRRRSGEELHPTGLRARKQRDARGLDIDQAHTTGYTHTSNNNNNNNNNDHKPSPSSPTLALESATSTHSDLTSSLVSLAQQLKLSAQQFSNELAGDAKAVQGTEEALGKNKDGLDTATRRMGVLRRMSEGRWWLGRMMLYAGIGALWLVLCLVVFLGPKIRF